MKPDGSQRLAFLDAWKVEPEMSEVIVLAKNDLAVPAGHGIAEHISVPAAFQHRDRDAEIGHLPTARMIAEELSHFSTAETE